MDRTEIAAMALQGLLAGEILIPNEMDENAAAAFVARSALRLADALLAELSKLPSPASNEPKEGPPSGRDAGAARDTQSRESGRSPVDVRGAVHGEAVSGTASDCRESTEENRASESGDAFDGEKDGAPRPEPAPTSPPIQVWDCEVDRYNGDGPCTGPIVYDSATHGRFCGPHMGAVPSGRAEWHRRNSARNAPAANARRIADAVG